MNKWLPKIKKGESGQAIILALIMLALGSMFLIPSFSLASTTVKTGQMVEENMKGVYAADAGIEDALWKLANDKPASFPHSYVTQGGGIFKVDRSFDECIKIRSHHNKYQYQEENKSKYCRRANDQSG